jgi:hypothetical protein
MLVEGGYLHSMKRLLEKAEQQPLPPSPGKPPPRPPNVVKRSLEKLARLLRGRRAN